MRHTLAHFNCLEYEQCEQCIRTVGSSIRSVCRFNTKRTRRKQDGNEQFLYLLMLKERSALVLSRVMLFDVYTTIPSSPPHTISLLFLFSTVYLFTFSMPITLYFLPSYRNLSHCAHCQRRFNESSCQR